MKNNNTIHNIVASTVLADAMRHIRNEFMIMIRGYLRPKEEDERLFAKAEHSARQALEVALSERSNKCVCPDCGSEELDFNYDADYDQVKDRDGNEYQYYAAVCRGCGKKVYLTAKYIGVLSVDEFEALQKNGTTSPFQPLLQKQK